MHEFALIQFAALMLTLGVCVYLFFSVKRDVRVVEARMLRHGEQLRAKVDELTAEMETLRKELEVMEQKSDPSATIARTLGSGIRIQALRMIKNGEGPEYIAATLGLPRTEVELLIKVQRMLADPQAEAVPTS
ncbi:MAG: hypothetical protein JSU00_16375 [Acidobacteria bacterium]|nr:hypothetical protein [Acidobacteriota bacterium]